MSIFAKKKGGRGLAPLLVLESSVGFYKFESSMSSTGIQVLKDFLTEVQILRTISQGLLQYGIKSLQTNRQGP